MYSFWKTTALFAANLVFVYIMLVSMQSKFQLKLKYVHLSIIIAVLIYTVIISAILTSKYEPFFFEVSPQRKACLQKQVSLTTPYDNITGSCDGCCGKGTKGGIPANYNDYGFSQENPEQYMEENAMNDNWIRNDLFNSCS